jgi:uncharacterized protein (TIGR02145 family)
MFAGLLVGCETKEPTNSENPNSSSGGGSDNSNAHAYVDLGLSVKWATCNVGADSPEEYGDYFAWGETQPKSTYNWETYKWCEGRYNTYTKYCTDSGYGTVDNKTILELSDDAANANWGGSWRLPTKEEQDELRTQCTWTWSTKNGVNGYIVVGPNGNSIFLPAAGFRNYGNGNVKGHGSNGYYWSSRPDYDNFAYYLSFFDGYESMESAYRRAGGYSVRCVQE